jgi:hypothetical protein
MLQGYGDLHAYSVAEAAYVVVFMFVSIGVAAYFVGTSVLLVAENEKKTGARPTPGCTDMKNGLPCTFHVTCILGMLLA